MPERLGWVFDLLLCRHSGCVKLNCAELMSQASSCTLAGGGDVRVVYSRRLLLVLALMLP
jgi:hypothetical protein